jgi:hypothetical protein
MSDKKLEKYLSNATAHQTSLDAYLQCPAETFLLYVCDAYDAFHHCEAKFTKKANGDYNSDSEDSLRLISCALLGSLMGHFETYQKTLLAGLIDTSSNFPDFDAEAFTKHFSKHCGGDISIQVGRLLSLRGASTQVGYVISDSLNGWHDPKRVAAFFKSMAIKKDIFTADHASDLEVLWQLRHSVVHTGAWLSLPDSQKVKRLSAHGNKPIVFNHPFVNATCRRFHKIVKHVNETILQECKPMLGTHASPAGSARLTELLSLKSPKTDWL